MARQLRIRARERQVRFYQPNSEACRNAEIARSETRSGVQRGELKSNGHHGCVSPRTSCRGGATATMRVGNASACALASSFVHGSMTWCEGERHPRSKKPKQYLPPLVAGGGGIAPQHYSASEPPGRAFAKHQRENEMEKYVVYTPDAEYRDIFAYSATGAKWKVYMMTSGRCPMSRMTAVRTA